MLCGSIFHQGTQAVPHHRSIYRGSRRVDFINQFDADHRIYAFGLRNTFDFTFHPITGDMYGSENGLGNCDELNLIKPGGNYGHPISSFEQDYPNNPSVLFLPLPSYQTYPTVPKLPHQPC